MFQRSPLSLMGWLALLAALGSAGLAVVAFMLPSVEDAICPMEGSHTLPSGRAAELCDISAETQPFTSVDWLVVRMVVPELPGPMWKARIWITTGFAAKSRFRRAGFVTSARAGHRAIDGRAVHPGRACAGDNSVDRGLRASGRCLHVGAFVMQIQDFAPRSSCEPQSEASESQTRFACGKACGLNPRSVISILAAEPQLYLGSWPGKTARSRTDGQTAGGKPRGRQVLSRTLPLAGRGARLVRLFQRGACPC
jgi:hypothetical protein